MKKLAPLIGGIVCIAALSGERMTAQTGVAVVGSGAVTAAHGTMHISATVGQAVIGLTATTTTEALQGFWHTPTSAKASLVQNEGASQKANSSLTLSSVPNPVSGSTTLSFSVPVAGHVSLVMYNALGEQVRTVLEEEIAAGSVSRTVDLSELPSGNYTALLRIGEQRGSTSLIVVD